MRTTIIIDDDLYKEVKIMAFKQNMTTSKYIESILLEHFGSKRIIDQRENEVEMSYDDLRRQLELENKSNNL